MFRQRILSHLPFGAVAVVMQVSVALSPGPANVMAFRVSTLLLALSFLIVVLRPTPPRTWVVRAAVYTASVALLIVADGSANSGLGLLMLIPIVGVSLYGEVWESVCVVAMEIVALTAVWLVEPHTLSEVVRRGLLVGIVGAMMSVAIHALRRRLSEANEQTARLLRQEKALNAAARELTSLSDPPAITALGTQLAARIASPRGSEILRATYFRIHDGTVTIDGQFDESGMMVEQSWLLEEHPALREVVETMQPVVAYLDPEAVGPVVRAMLDETGITHGAWVPVCPDGSLHGILGIASRGAPVPQECVERCIALGHFLELALSNWAAHEKLREQATAEERRRIARELHDGLAHELAFIASKTRGWSSNRPVTLDVRELSGAADRALDEARRAITVLSVPEPQSLECAIAQTAEDLASRLGLSVSLELAEDVDLPGEVTENLLRIVREAVTNAATHGRAQHVKVRLEHADHVRLVIEDDGCGFDPAGGSLPGFGLLSMEERASSVGAVLNLDSAPAQGTRVEVAFS